MMVAWNLGASICICMRGGVWVDITGFQFLEIFVIIPKYTELSVTKFKSIICLQSARLGIYN